MGDYGRGTPSPKWAQKFLELRAARMLSQSDVAAAAGRSQSFVSRFERGRDLRLSELEALFAALATSPRSERRP